MRRVMLSVAGDGLREGFVGAFAPCDLVQHVTQRQQINRAERRSIRRNQLELIRRIDIGPSARDRAKPTVLALIDHPVFAPMTAPTDQLELATAKRMEGMRDPYLLAGRTRMACSRRPSPKPRSSRRCS
jgi:hypothetical protein